MKAGILVILIISNMISYSQDIEDKVGRIEIEENFLKTRYYHESESYKKFKDLKSIIFSMEDSLSRGYFLKSRKLDAYVSATSFLGGTIIGYSLADVILNDNNLNPTVLFSGVAVTIISSIISLKAGNMKKKTIVRHNFNLKTNFGISANLNHSLPIYSFGFKLGIR